MPFYNVANRAKTAHGGKKGRLPEGQYQMRPTKASGETSRKGDPKILLECAILAKGADYNGAIVRHHFMLDNEQSMDKAFRLLYLAGANMAQFEGDDGTKVLEVFQDLVMAGPVLTFQAKHAKDNDQYNNWYLVEESVPVVFDGGQGAEAPAQPAAEAELPPPPPVAAPQPPVVAPAPAAANKKKNPFAR